MSVEPGNVFGVRMQCVFRYGAAMGASDFTKLVKRRGAAAVISERFQVAVTVTVTKETTSRQLAWIAYLGILTDLATKHGVLSYSKNGDWFTQAPRDAAKDKDTFEYCYNTFQTKKTVSAAAEPEQKTHLYVVGSFANARSARKAERVANTQSNLQAVRAGYVVRFFGTAASQALGLLMFRVILQILENNRGYYKSAAAGFMEVLDPKHIDVGNEFKLVTAEGRARSQQFQWQGMYRTAQAATEPATLDRKVFVTGFEILVRKGTSVARQIMPYLRRYEAETTNPAFHEPNVRKFNNFDDNTMYLVEIVTHDPVRAFQDLVRWLSAAPWCRGPAGARRWVGDNRSNGEPVPFDSDDGRKTLRRQFQNVTELVGPNRARQYNQAYGVHHAT